MGKKGSGGALERSRHVVVTIASLGINRFSLVQEERAGRVGNIKTGGKEGGSLRMGGRTGDGKTVGGLAGQ
jgi:hypothetical protein